MARQGTCLLTLRIRSESEFSVLLLQRMMLDRREAQYFKSKNINT